MTNKLMKRKGLTTSFMAATAVALVAMPAASASAADLPFTDVSGNYDKAVEFLFANGLASGKTSTTFGVADNITRADAAVMIAHALGFDENGTYKKTGFKDVPSRAAWAVNALVEAKIVDGKNHTRFGSDEALTRNEAAAIIARAAKLSINNELSKSQFADVNKRFAPYVQALLDEEIAQGKTDKLFGADEPVKRGELAIFLNRAKEKFGFLDLMVMHLNDHHGYLDNFPQISTLVEDLRENNKNNLLLHAGDVFSGDLYYNIFKGEADVAMMNYLKFDAMTFGNHEFDLGGSEEGHLALQKFIKAAQFPLLGGNIDFSKDELFNGLQTREISDHPENGHIYDGIIQEIGGQKVGIFSLTTEETENIASPVDVTFEDYIERAQAAVKAFEDQGINKIIALTHVGIDDAYVHGNDKALANALPQIDIIVGGHSHTKLEKAEVVQNGGNQTLIVQSNEYAKFLGTLDVRFNKDGEIYSYNRELLNPASEDIKADARATQILAPFKAEVNKLLEASIGVEAKVPLDAERDNANEGVSSPRHNETTLGNVIADGMLWKAKSINPKTSIALQNGGGIRTSIGAGDITTGAVLKVMPFGNALSIAELSGADLLAVLEHSVRAETIEGGKGLKENGAFLHVSGMKFTYDSSKPIGQRVQSVQVLEEGEYVDLDKAKTYFIATNAFTASGGDDYEVFAKAHKAGKVSEPGFVDYENFIEYVKSLEGDLAPEIEGRIIDLNLETQQNGFKLEK